MKITELVWGPRLNGMLGEQAHAVFANGYTASCLRGPDSCFSYTRGGTYEIAVINSATDKIDYTTPITDDVLGHLTEEEANAVLAAIEALPNIIPNPPDDKVQNRV
jgi:hypothetical protein